MRSLKFSLPAIVLTFLASAVEGQIPSDPNLISDRTQFETIGQIIHFTDFEEFSGDWSFPGDPWTSGGVTYTSGCTNPGNCNVILGVEGTLYSPLSDILCYNYWTPVTAEVSTIPDRFNLIAFDVGYVTLGLHGPVDIRVITNLEVYEYSGITLQSWDSGSDFFGFKTPGVSEYVTNFELDSGLLGVGPCIDNVTLAIGGIEVAIDIKFCSNPNAFNCKKKGVLPVTTFGTEDFLVQDIDPNSLRLCTEDLSACTGAPREYSYADRGDPTTDLGAAMCAIDPDTGEEVLNQDGFLDLDAAFEASEVQEMLGIFCYLHKGAISESLVLIGETYEGITIYSVPLDNVGIDRLLKVNKPSVVGDCPCWTPDHLTMLPTPGEVAFCEARPDGLTIWQSGCEHDYSVNIEVWGLGCGTNQFCPEFNNGSFGAEINEAEYVICANQISDRCDQLGIDY